MKPTAHYGGLGSSVRETELPNIYLWANSKGHQKRRLGLWQKNDNAGHFRHGTSPEAQGGGAAGRRRRGTAPHLKKPKGEKCNKYKMILKKVYSNKKMIKVAPSGTGKEKGLAGASCPKYEMAGAGPGTASSKRPANGGPTVHGGGGKRQRGSALTERAVSQIEASFFSGEGNGDDAATVRKAIVGAVEAASRDTDEALATMTKAVMGKIRPYVEDPSFREWWQELWCVNPLTLLFFYHAAGWSDGTRGIWSYPPFDNVTKWNGEEVTAKTHWGGTPDDLADLDLDLDVGDFQNMFAVVPTESSRSQVTIRKIRDVHTGTFSTANRTSISRQHYARQMLFPYAKSKWMHLFFARKCGFSPQEKKFLYDDHSQNWILGGLDALRDLLAEADEGSPATTIPPINLGPETDAPAGYWTHYSLHPWAAGNHLAQWEDVSRRLRGSSSSFALGGVDPKGQEGASSPSEEEEGASSSGNLGNVRDVVPPELELVVDPIDPKGQATISFPCYVETARGRRRGVDGNAYTRHELQRKYQSVGEANAAYDAAQPCYPEDFVTEYRPVYPAAKDPHSAAQYSQSCLPYDHYMDYYQSMGTSEEESVAAWERAEGESFYRPLPVARIPTRAAFEGFLVSTLQSAAKGQACPENPEGTFARAGADYPVRDIAAYWAVHRWPLRRAQSTLPWTVPAWSSQAFQPLGAPGGGTATEHLPPRLCITLKHVFMWANLYVPKGVNRSELKAARLAALLPPPLCTYNPQKLPGKLGIAWPQEGGHATIYSPTADNWSICTTGISSSQATDALQRTVRELNKLDITNQEVDVNSELLRVSHLFSLRCHHEIHILPLFDSIWEHFCHHQECFHAPPSISTQRQSKRQNNRVTIPLVDPEPKTEPRATLTCELYATGTITIRTRATDTTLNGEREAFATAKEAISSIWATHIAPHFGERRFKGSGI